MVPLLLELLELGTEVFLESEFAKSGILTLLFVGVTEGLGGVFVVVGQGFEGFVGDAVVEFVGGDEAHNGVAALDVVVEEVEGFAGDVGLQPEGDFAEFDREGVEVHAVDAGADDIAEGEAEGGGRGLFLAGADGGEFVGNTAGGGEQDVSGSAGNVGHAEREQGGGGIGLFELVGDEVVEGVADEGLDEVVGGVVGTGFGAAFAFGEVEGWKVEGCGLLVAGSRFRVEG